jgi:hypothetical protein
MTDEQMRQGSARIGALEAEMKAAGALVFSGRLTEPGKARVVRMARDRVVTTDGPYLETKEVLGGFYIIEADDLDTALTWASKTTAAVGMPIEVRPFWSQAVA